MKIQVAKLMKTYTTISNNIGKYLNFEDTFRYACLAFTPTKENNSFTDSTFKQIMWLTKDTSENTIKDFVSRLRKSGFIEIETYNQTVHIKRNKYFMKKETENFRMIGNEIIELDLKPAHKGFLIQLFGLCLNNTRRCEFTNTKIAQQLNVVPSTVGKYTKELMQLGHLKKLKKGYEIQGEYFINALTQKEKERLEELEFVKQKSEELKFLYPDNYISEIIDNTNWSNIVHPKKYIQAIEAGVANFPKKGKEIIEEIYL